jgi:hypothetical protein
MPAKHVFINPMASHVEAVLVEVHSATIRIGDATADVQRVLHARAERLIWSERQHMTVLRPLPTASNLRSIKPSDVHGAELLRSVCHAAVELDLDWSVGIHAHAATAGGDADESRLLGARALRSVRARSRCHENGSDDRQTECSYR